MGIVILTITKPFRRQRRHWGDKWKAQNAKSTPQSSVDRHGSRSALSMLYLLLGQCSPQTESPPYLNHLNIWNSLSTDANWKTIARKLCRQFFKISYKMTFRECISEPYIHVALGQALSPGFSLYMHFANILLNPTTWNPTPRSQALQDERHQTCVKAFLYQVKLNVKTWETPAGRLHHTCSQMC